MFSSSFDENHAKYQPYYGWNRANSNEYNVPSAVPIIPYALVSPGFGQYPNHGQFSTMMTYEGEAPRLMTSQHHRHQGRVHFAEHDTITDHAPQAHKGRVHFAEHDTITDHAPQAHKGRVHFAEHDTITDHAPQARSRVHFAEHDRMTDHAPQARKGKVHFAEHDTSNQLGDQKNGRLKVHQDSSIDAEADGFIKLKHKNFELSRWETFKGY